MVTKPVDQWPGMTRASFKNLLDYLRVVADRLGLRDWTITLIGIPLDGLDDDGPIAVVDPTYGRKRATVRVEQYFMQRDADDRRHVITHELLHCVLEPGCARLRHMLPRALGQQSYDLVMQAFRLDTEYAVDSIADFLAPFMPEAPD